MRKPYCILLVSFSAIFVGCSNQPSAEVDKPRVIDSSVVVVSDSMIIPSTILTKEQQDKLTPDQVIAELMKGNEEYVNDRLTIRNTSARIREASLGQYPKAVILSCLDSRVPVEDVFHEGIGDLFVTRVAGNIINEDILGSMEYGCKVSGSKLILVLGHEYCGAIKSAIDGVKLGNITALLTKIQPAVRHVADSLKSTVSSKDAASVELVCYENVRMAIAGIRKSSPILREMEQKGEIKIIGAVYDMRTGKVDFF
jgi:carbonic anhydrase